ncbi:hypothetical protein E3N88_32026 [Mikania micrantha]|uniref:Uncharacterized protein n=1 Tax=Mikania micrantha TaxID=192012 RepID=A0A5N6M7U4_9ASTR|nr:hypothetical protein E3N88_32026 [Mikania micrantha]
MGAWLTIFENRSNVDMEVRVFVPPDRPDRYRTIVRVKPGHTREVLTKILCNWEEYFTCETDNHIFLIIFIHERVYDSMGVPWGYAPLAGLRGQRPRRERCSRVVSCYNYALKRKREGKSGCSQLQSNSLHVSVIDFVVGKEIGDVEVKWHPDSVTSKVEVATIPQSDLIPDYTDVVEDTVRPHFADGKVALDRCRYWIRYGLLYVDGLSRLGQADSTPNFSFKATDRNIISRADVYSNFPSKLGSLLHVAAAADEARNQNLATEALSINIAFRAICRSVVVALIIKAMTCITEQDTIHKWISINGVMPNKPLDLAILSW